jgi:hypothetical protein
VRCPATAFRFGRVRWSTPLDNLSGDPAQEYFADCMNDELITMLAKDSTLRIVSRATVMQYKGARRPLPEIARALGVDGILEGSVSRTGMHVHLLYRLFERTTTPISGRRVITGPETMWPPCRGRRPVTLQLVFTVRSLHPVPPAM